MSRWTDKAGGHHFEQYENAAYRPTVRRRSQNDLSVVDFTDGRYLTSLTAAAGNTLGQFDGTVTILARDAYYATSGGTFLMRTPTAAAFGVYLAQANTAYMDWGPGGASDVRTSFGITRDPDWSIYQLVRRGPEYRWYQDGALIHTATTKTGTFQNLSGFTQLGFDARTSDPTNRGQMMDLAELRCYNRALTLGQMAEERAELTTKWRLFYREAAISVPDTVAQWDASSLGLSDGANVTSWAALIGGSDYTLNTLSGGGVAPLQRYKSGCPGVRFTTTGWIRTSASPNPFPGNDFAYFVVIGMGPQVNQWASPLDFTHNTPSNGNTTLLRYGATSRWWAPWYRSAGGPVEAAAADHTVAWRGEGRQVVAVNKNGTAMTLRNGLRDKLSYTAGSASYVHAARQINFGGSAGVTRHFMGDIHEVILCSAGQPESEMDRHCRSLARKWNIAL